MNYLKLISETIQNLAKEFQSNPFNYLYEIELQAQLYVSLKKLTNENISFNFTNKEYNDIHTDFSIVRIEYPYNQNWIDIAILDRNRFISKGFKLNGNPLYNEPVDIAIEIKYEMFNESKDYHSDIIKLNNLIKNDDEKYRINTGIAILFTHNKNGISTIHYNDLMINDFNLSIGCVNKVVIYPEIFDLEKGKSHN